MRRIVQFALACAAVIQALLACSNTPAADCPPRPDDPQGYLVAICRYIRDNRINVAPADPARYNIKRIEQGTKNEHAVVWVFLDCCYLGDVAMIDAATGEVLDFRVGAK